MAEKVLSTEVRKQIAAIDGMTLAEIRAMLAKCKTDLLVGRVTPDEGNALNHAASVRVQKIKWPISS